MFYELNDEQKAFRQRVRQIYEREVSPLVEEYERKEAFPVQLFPILGAEHLLCLRCPKKYGGPGLDKISECITVEELNRICVGIGASIMVQGGLATDPILHFGSEDLKRKYLSPAVRGEKIGAFALTEPNAGSDASGIRTTAVKQGEGYRLNGPKTFITNGTICHFATVAAYTDPARRGKGINLFVVEREDPGFSVTKKLRKLGNHSADTAELAFDDCYVPERKDAWRTARGRIGAVRRNPQIRKADLWGQKHGSGSGGLRRHPLLRQENPETGPASLQVTGDSIHPGGDGDVTGGHPLHDLSRRVAF